MPDTWGLMHTITSRHECFLFLVHKSRPTSQHENNLKLSFVYVPTSSSFGRVRRTNEVGYHPSAGRIGDPEVTVLKEIPQTSISIIGVIWADMRKLVDIRVQCRFSF
jgi:hypothetical protein